MQISDPSNFERSDPRDTGIKKCAIQFGFGSVMIDYLVQSVSKRLQLRNGS